tara:strand:+ start:135 stop:290 length:156 start_codon:yes stop_codon:yes gene_type:complete
MPYKIEAECPNCKMKAKGKDELEERFGWRNVGGKTIPQSHCRKCRTIRKSD